MSEAPSPSAGDRHSECPWVQIESETIPYRLHDLLRIDEARLRYRRFDGRMSVPMTRVNFARGAAVGVLLYDREQDVVALVRQFRYPVYAGLDPEARQGEEARRAWILEIVAGIAEDDELMPEVAQRELIEEAGYAVGDLHLIASIYPSPGGSSELIHVYWAEVSARERTHVGGGLEREGEDTEVVVLPFQEAMAMVEDGQIRDAKTILALQYLALKVRE